MTSVNPYTSPVSIFLSLLGTNNWPHPISTPSLIPIGGPNQRNLASNAWNTLGVSYMSAFCRILVRTRPVPIHHHTTDNPFRGGHPLERKAGCFDMNCGVWARSDVRNKISEGTDNSAVMTCVTRLVRLNCGCKSSPQAFGWTSCPHEANYLSQQ